MTVMQKSFELHLEPFDGPMALLLQLIQGEKMDITTIALAQVTERYLKEIEKVAETYPELLADFLVVATRLVYLKSQALLPYLTWEEDEADLEAQLKMYKLYFEAAKKLYKRISRKTFAHFRGIQTTTLEVRFAPPASVTTKKLADIYHALLQRQPKLTLLPQQVILRTIHIHEKIAEIKKHVMEKASVAFEEILKDRRDTLELVVSFLALLDLVKQRMVRVQQGGNFTSITIVKM